MTATMMLVVTKARKRIELAREDIIEKFFLLVDQLIDFQNVRPFGLPHMAPEETLLIPLQLDAAAGSRLQLDDVANLEICNLAKGEEALLKNCLQRHLGF